jgi:eukaryotic-like serine/threonine-protein kinase
MQALAVEYWQEKQLDKSIPLFEEILKRREALLGRQHPDTLISVINLGVNYKDAGRLEEALPLLEEAHRAGRKSPALQWVGLALMDGYLLAGKIQQAHVLAKEMLDDVRETSPKESPQLAADLAYFGYWLQTVKAFADAETWLRECLDIRNKTQPDDWNTFNTQSTLGGALLGQKKYDEAEPMLLQGYQGMDRREKAIPAPARVRLTESLERLVSLYESRRGDGDAEKAARYRELLDQRKASETTTRPGSR